MNDQICSWSKIEICFCFVIYFYFNDARYSKIFPYITTSFVCIWMLFLYEKHLHTNNINLLGIFYDIKSVKLQYNSQTWPYNIQGAVLLYHMAYFTPFRPSYVGLFIFHTKPKQFHSHLKLSKLLCFSFGI